MWLSTHQRANERQKFDRWQARNHDEDQVGNVISNMQQFNLFASYNDAFLALRWRGRKRKTKFLMHFEFNLLENENFHVSSESSEKKASEVFSYGR